MLWIRTGTKIEGMNFIQFPFTLPIQIRAAFQAGVSSTSCQFSGLCTGLLSRKICYFHAFFYSLWSKRDKHFLSVLLHEAFLFFCDKIFTSGDHFVIIWITEKKLSVER